MQWLGPGSLAGPMRLCGPARLRRPSPEDKRRLRILVAGRQGDPGVGGGGVGEGWRGGDPGGGGVRDAGGPAEGGELDGGWVVLQGEVHCEELRSWDQ